MNSTKIPANWENDAIPASVTDDAGVTHYAYTFTTDIGGEPYEITTYGIDSRHAMDKARFLFFENFDWEIHGHNAGLDATKEQKAPLGGHGSQRDGI